jgi:hypothetical protein
MSPFVNWFINRRNFREEFMAKYFKLTAFLIIISGMFIQSTMAYDIPQRKIEVKPYLSLFFPNDLWEMESRSSSVDNKSAFGVGFKIRTQFNKQFGFVINTAYTSFDVTNDSSNDGAIFTVGGYYAKSFGFGNLTLDFGYGIIIASDEALGLLLPSLEYSRPITDRISIALEFGWPIPNDWLRSFELKENYSSFALSLGTAIIF